MTKDEMLEQVANKYESEGYHVTRDPGGGFLPFPISDLRQHIDLIFEKDGKYTFVEVKRRDQLREISPGRRCTGLRPQDAVQ
jgi:Holliday junction resolvase-like predicted endonuclease